MTFNRLKDRSVKETFYTERIRELWMEHGQPGKR